MMFVMTQSLHKTRCNGVVDASMQLDEWALLPCKRS